MKKILVPYDFSENSELALLTAVQLAEKLDVEISIVYVFDFSGFGNDQDIEGFGLDALDFARDLRNDYASRLSEVASATGLHSSKIIADVLKGKIVPRIVEHTQLHGHDLIILGETGNTYNIGDHFMGTLMDKIVHKSPVPVLVVKTKVDMDEAGKLVLIDDFQNLGRLIGRVKAIRKLWDTKIDIVRINTPRNFLSDVELNNLLIDRRKDPDLQGCSFHSFNHDTIADGVIYYSMRVKADMLVVGGKHQSQMRRWFLQEDMAERIMDFADVPVLILD